MRDLVRREMEAGALGIGSSLIYAPAFYATTEELIELCKVAAKYRGKYISHIRSEGNRLVEAVEELIRISREARIPAEIYHLKAAGEANWPKMPRVIAMIEEARREGLRITADMYTYTAGATGLDASMPPWVLDGGYEEAFKRLRDPLTAQEDRRGDPHAVARLGEPLPRRRIARPRPAGGVQVRRAEAADRQDPRGGGAAARRRPGRHHHEPGARGPHRGSGTVYFMMSEENLTTQIRLPWVSFGSDAASMAPEPPFTKSAAHPRAYGNFARLLGKYVRDEKVADARRGDSPPERPAGDQPRAR